MKIAILGGGVMGSVLLGVLAKNGLAGKVVVCDRDMAKLKRLKKSFPRTTLTKDPSKIADANMVFLAVKPQDFRAINFKAGKSVLVISIMAGVPITSIRRRLGASRIIRAMPNTPAQLGLGFTAWTATKTVSRQQRNFARTVFGAMGEELYVSSENIINKFTAVSGSGPAYFFYATLALLEAARALGIKTTDAERAARKTLEGAAALLASGGDIATRISQVASKGGTTEAALRVFKKSGFENSWKRAVVAAYRRAKELEKLSKFG